MNVSPDFKPLFGQFFTGEPLTEAEATYAEVDPIIAATGVTVIRHWRVARPRYDRPPLDRIMLPPKSRFMDEPQYQATLLHEVFHHVEQRIGWEGSSHQNELVAEIATSNVESLFRMRPDQCRANIEKWLPWWTMEVRSDPAYLFDAVAQAAKAVNFLLDLRRQSAA
jgi:antirestriction protein ArdC